VAYFAQFLSAMKNVNKVKFSETKLSKVIWFSKKCNLGMPNGVSEN